MRHSKFPNVFGGFILLADNVCRSDAFREERTAKGGRSNEHEFLHLCFTFSGFPD